MEFLPRTLLFYILTHVYLFWCLYRLLGRRRAVFALLPPFAIMGLFPYVFHLLPAGRAQELFAAAGGVWLPAAFFCLIVFAMADALSCVALLLRKLFPSGLLLFFFRRRYFALLVLLAACLYGYGLYEAHSLRLTRLQLTSAKLPPGTQSLRIVLATDLHIGPQTGTPMLRRTVEAMLAERPDLILLGGDILDDAFQGTPQDVAELRRLRAPLGVFGVLGNHDSFGGYRHAVDTLARSGIRLLSDQSAVSGPVRIVGLDDPDVSEQKEEEAAAGAPGTSPLSPPKKRAPGKSNPQKSAVDVAALLRRGPRDLFTILLDHRPRRHRGSIGLFDLQLSGHTHGGQLILLQPTLEREYGLPTGYSERRSAAGASACFISTGTGYSKLPIRFLVPPEIVVIDIVPPPKGTAR